MPHIIQWHAEEAILKQHDSQPVLWYSYLLSYVYNYFQSSNNDHM